eukprot:6303117-Amphidinium_carterae.2
MTAQVIVGQLCNTVEVQISLEEFVKSKAIFQLRNLSTSFINAGTEVQSASMHTQVPGGINDS